MKRKKVTERALLLKSNQVDHDDEEGQLEVARMAFWMRDQEEEEKERSERLISANEQIRSWTEYNMGKFRDFDPSHACHFHSCSFEPIHQLKNYFGCRFHGRVHECLRDRTCPPAHRSGYTVCSFTGQEIHADSNAWFQHPGELERQPRKRGRGARTSDRPRFLPDSEQKILTILDDLFLEKENRRKVVMGCVEQADRRCSENVRKAFIDHMMKFDPEGLTPLPVFTDMISVAQAAWSEVDIYDLPHKKITEPPEDSLVVPEYAEVWRGRLSLFLANVWTSMEEAGMRKRTECLQEMVLYILYALAKDKQIKVQDFHLGREIDVLKYLPPESILGQLRNNLIKKRYDATLYKKGKRAFTEQIMIMTKEQKTELQNHCHKILDGSDEISRGGLATIFGREDRLELFSINPDTSKN